MSVADHLQQSRSIEQSFRGVSWAESGLDGNGPDWRKREKIRAQLTNHAIRMGGKSANEENFEREMVINDCDASTYKYEVLKP